MGGAICRGTNVRYLARARLYGARTYSILGRPSTSRTAAWKRLGIALATGKYRRGDLLLLADYYDPFVLYKVTVG